MPTSECACSTYHRPHPLRLVHTYGQPLCPTTADNVTVLLERFRTAGKVRYEDTKGSRAFARDLAKAIFAAETGTTESELEDASEPETASEPEAEIVADEPEAEVLSPAEAQAEAQAEAEEIEAEEIEAEETGLDPAFSTPEF